METKQTFTFTAPSGFEVELNRMKAYHQEWLTTNSGKKGGIKGPKKNKSEKSVEGIMADIVVRIDEDTDITTEKILEIPSYDFKYMLFVARFFSCDVHFIERMHEWNEYQANLIRWKLARKFQFETDATILDQEIMDAGFKKDGENEQDVVADRERFEEWAAGQDIQEKDEAPEYESELEPHIFKFRYEWEEGEELESHEYELELHMHEFKVRNPLKKFSWKELNAGRNNKGMDNKDMEVFLPIAKQKLVWHILDLKIEEAERGGFQPEEININTSLKWRKPRILNPKESEPGSFVPINANSSKFEYLDIEAYRKSVFETEGDVDSFITVRLPGNGKLVKVDVLNTKAFFIPSGVL